MSGKVIWMNWSPGEDGKTVEDRKQSVSRGGSLWKEYFKLRSVRDCNDQVYGMVIQKKF